MGRMRCAGRTSARQPRLETLLASRGTAQRLDAFESHGIAQRAIRRIALTHDPFSHLLRVARAVRRQMAHAGVSDLALLEEAMADDVANASMLAAFEQPD